ncbi:MAG: cytochrome C oxidase subunit II, partial [Cyanobacteria bacterium P01_D01_bin.115]
ATKPGSYPVVCAELCGGYHGAMRTQVIVHNPADFNNWIESRIAQADINPKEAIAVNPSELSDEDYLAPYADNLDVNTELLAQLSN